MNWNNKVLTAFLKYKIIIYSFVALLCAIGIICIYNDKEPHFKEIALEALLALFSTSLILVLVDAIKDKAEDEAQKKEIEKIFDETMKKEDGIIPRIEAAQDKHKDAIEQSLANCLVEKSDLVSKLNDESVDSFMQDCISHYCQQLSEHYKNYIKDNINVFRRNFNYDVTVSIKDKKISQNITYERFFRDCNSRATYQLKSLFLFGTNELDEAMDDDSYFFREELTNPKLLDSISNILKAPSKDIKQKLIKELDLEIYINNINEKIDDSEIQYEILKNNSENNIGLLFYVNIPQDHISHTNDSYVYYKGRVSCKYNYDIDNIFYCIFSNPTTGNTHFSIHFENFDPKTFNFKDVKHLTMISLKKKKKNGGKHEEFTLQPSSNNNTIIFNTEKTIFPRGGIVIRW